MKIGIITHLTTDKSAGIGTYVSSLVEHLQLIDKDNQYFLFTFTGNRNLFNITNPNFKEIRTKGFGERITRRNVFRLKYYLWSKFVLPRWSRRLELDVLHIPSTWFVERITNTKQVITIHDLAEFYTNRYSALLGNVKKRMVDSAIRKSDALITVSSFSASEINNIYRTGNKPRKVIYNGLTESCIPHEEVDVKKVLQKFNVSAKKYFVFIGTMQKHKNVPNMLRAFHSIIPDFPDIKFLLAGRLDNGYDAIKSVIDELGLQENVVISNYVTSVEKAVLLQNTIAFVFVSQYEGFGFPVLEMQSMRVPVIISDASSLPEIAGPGALSVPYTNIEEIASAMKRCICDREFVAAVTEAGTKNLLRFSWIDAAKQTLEVYKNVVQAPAFSPDGFSNS